MPFRRSALLLSLSLSAAMAVVPDLTGKVTGTDGKGIPGVRIGLKHALLYTFTDSTGAYKLDGNALPIAREARMEAGPALRGNAVAFSVAGSGTSVDLRTFDAFGRAIGTPWHGVLKAGDYALPLAPMPAGSLGFVKMRIGARSHVLRYFAPDVAPMQRAPAASAPALMKASASEYDTLQASKDAYTPDYKRINSFTGVNDFFLEQPRTFWGDPTAVPPASLVMTYRFLNRTNGKYADKDIYWTFTGFKLGTQDPIPTQSGNLADKPLLDLPLHHAGRITFHLGSPTGEYTDFIEQTADDLGWHGNTTRVDAYGLPMAMRLLCDDRDQLLGEKYEVFYLGREKFFQRYLASVPAEFQHNADASAKRLRITAPGKGDMLFNPGQQYENYFTNYFKELSLSGPKVTTQFAFACQDDFFNQKADLCGAINRHVAQLPQAQWKNPEFFYQQAPANFYAKFFHEYSWSEKAYGFAYDDAAEMAAFAECAKPKALIIAIGY